MKTLEHEIRDLLERKNESTNKNKKDDKKNTTKDDTSSDNIDTALDAASLIPGPVGSAASLASAAKSASKGDYTGAALDVAGALPGVGYAAKAAKAGRTVGKTAAKTARKSTKIIDLPKEAPKSTPPIRKPDVETIDPSRIEIIPPASSSRRLPDTPKTKRTQDITIPKKDSKPPKKGRTPPKDKNKLLRRLVGLSLLKNLLGVGDGSGGGAISSPGNIEQLHTIGSARAIGEETNGTEIRKKIENVGRPKPKLNKLNTILGKQGSIQTKIVDEENEKKKKETATVKWNQDLNKDTN